MNDNIQCPICKRDVPNEYQEKHHLVPKCRKGKETITLCCNCGDMLHKIFTNKELEKEYNSLDKILSKREVKNWIKWVSKKNHSFSVCMKSKKKR